MARVREFRLSIAAHLAIAFVLVLLLAAAANFAVTRVTTLIETSRTIRERDTAAPRAPASATVAFDQPATVSAQELALKLAVDRYEMAVLARSRTNAADVRTRLNTATRELQTAADDYLARKDLTDPRIKATASSLRRYSLDAESTIRSADKRRAAIAAYAGRFEEMNGRMKASVDAAWRIFGRVVARQSLIQLSNELDEIRRGFAKLDTSEPDSAAIAALVAAEHTFAKSLDDNDRSLQRSQGAAWVQAMRSDLQDLIELRKEIQLTHDISHKAASTFAKSTQNLLQLLSDQTSTSSERRVSTPSHDQSNEKARTPTAASMEPADQTVHISQTPADPERQHAMAWLTVAVLAMLLTVCVATVLSIVRPVRRLLRATERLGEGHLEPVAPGGIKELHTLGHAFNQMAVEVVSAREQMRIHQSDLETRIAERTRELQQLAERDPLTHLLNRREFFASFDRILARAGSDHQRIGLFFLDLDNFKNINDSMGHEFGDRVLVHVAERLREVIGSTDLAARLGGDEFTLVCTEGASIDEFVAAGQRILDAFREPLRIDHRELTVNISIGASIYPDNDQNSAALLRAADVALFHAKALGRNRLAMFTPALLQAAAARFATEQGLRRAIEHGEFELVFQPEVHVDSLKATLVEALLRWRMPDGRLAGPGEFLSVAEESGLIVQIGDWVLRAAVAAAARWHYGEWPEVRVAINVSPRQLLDGRLVDSLSDLLREFQLPPRCIEVELTEDVLQTGAEVIATLHRLRGIGVGIALDDFGTGYSSLSSLEQLPLTRIKLDKSLIARIDSAGRSPAIARAILSMCRTLDLEVTAEGIERPEQFRMLAQHGEMHLQGYLLCRPVAESDVLEALVATQQRVRLLSDKSSAELLQSSVEPSRATLG